MTKIGDDKNLVPSIQNLTYWDHSIDIESLHKRLYMSLSTPVVRIARACFSNEQFAGVLGQAGCRQYHFN